MRVFRLDLGARWFEEARPPTLRGRISVITRGGALRSGRGSGVIQYEQSENHCQLSSGANRSLMKDQPR
ncbi:MAG: hypothetical protein ACI80V_002210 [Rhodothermales bacterium]|jgi:hypothetical protein